MKTYCYFFLLSLTIASCDSKIKNSDAIVEIEEGTAIDNLDSEKTSIKRNKVLGSWVGYFEEDADNNGYSLKAIYADEGFYWNRENKINISIDQIKGGIVTGHSVVAGSKRPFNGSIQDGVFTVKEPGDENYDGTFKFHITENTLIGKWTAYKDIEIKNRKYTLEKKQFSYKPDVMLERSQLYLDWNNFIEENEITEYDEEYIEEWIKKEFATATEVIYSINASNTVLTKTDVENLKKGDLRIIRNTIYARHGYSFKKRPLRVFFDAQSWYIPVYVDITEEFSAVEKKNIQLLLRYEKNAAEYYDYFGRG